MFDLLGYWSIVSIITLSVALPFFVILYHAVISMVGKILNNRWDGRDAVHKIIQIDEEEGIYYLGTKLINAPVMYITGVGGLLYLLFITIHVLENSLKFGLTLIEVTHTLATNIAPIGVWIVIPVALYFGIIFGGRKYIKVKAKLDTINAKLKEMDNV